MPSDFEYRHLTGGLYLTRPKSKAGWRVIPLVEPAQDDHQGPASRRPRRTSTGLCSPAPDGGCRSTRNDADGRAWNATLDKIGIDRDVVLHGLRHTAADLLYLAGVPEDLIQEILGHSSRTVTRGYKSLRNRDRLEGAMGLLSELITRSELERTRGTGVSSLPALE